MIAWHTKGPHAEDFLRHRPHHSKVPPKCPGSVQDDARLEMQAHLPSSPGSFAMRAHWLPYLACACKPGATYTSENITHP